MSGNAEFFTDLFPRKTFKAVEGYFAGHFTTTCHHFVYKHGGFQFGRLVRRNFTPGAFYEGFLEYLLFSLCLTHDSYERAKQVCGEVSNGRTTATPFLADCLRNRGGCLFEEVQSKGRIAKQLFCVGDRAWSNLLCNGKDDRVDLSSKAVNRVQQERWTGPSFSPWAHGDPSITRREPFAGLDVARRPAVSSELIDSIVLWYYLRTSAIFVVLTSCSTGTICAEHFELTVWTRVA